jgi:hypothetical protein
MKALFTKSAQCNQLTEASLIFLMVTPESIVVPLRVNIFSDCHSMVLTTFDYFDRLRNRIADSLKRLYYSSNCLLSRREFFPG